MYEGNSLPTLSQERLFIDTSTIDPATSISIAEAIRAAGAGSFIDAPMSGGVVGASAGTLTFMLGATDALIPRATLALTPMAKRIVPMGPPGSGLKAKLANNYLLALNNIATCEAMHMGVSWGLEPSALAALINMSTGKCWPSEVNNPVPGVVATSPASRGYSGGFGVALMNKDLKLALKAVDDAGLKISMGQQARKVYDQLENDPALKKLDFSAVYRWLGGKE
jgi:3-hydroxyisobutyrate dehydrogenase-like beta-hydroxyacid dehydrogenase